MRAASNAALEDSSSMPKKLVAEPVTAGSSRSLNCRSRVDIIADASLLQTDGPKQKVGEPPTSLARRLPDSARQSFTRGAPSSLSGHTTCLTPDGALPA